MIRHRPLLVLAVLAPLALAGCKSTGMNDVTGSIDPASPAAPSSEDAGRALAAQWRPRYEADPTNRTAALNYALGLRAATQYAQAVAVLQNIAMRYPDDRRVLSAYGKALADAGRLPEAAEVLAKAHTPDDPDWSVLSAQGSVADEMGDHAAAQNYYLAALKIVPDEPSVLSNLGLSFALAKDLPQAERMLRRAADNPRADARVRQNLALVLALAGKFKEAEDIERRDLSAQDAAANVAAIRAMIAQSNTWNDLRALDRKAPVRSQLGATPIPSAGPARPADAAAAGK